MFGKLCDWTTTNWGQGLIAGTLIVVGASHFGYLSGIADTSLPLVGSVGNLIGIVAVVGGACLLMECCGPSDRIAGTGNPYTN